jgi:alpha-ketoglutarate-dependent taurine dioxygenase
MMHCRPLGQYTGVEITDVDVTKPIDGHVMSTLRDALAQYGVIVIRGQTIDDAAQVAFSRCFGSLERFVRKDLTNADFPEIMEIADVGDKTKWLSTAQLWHTDGSYKPVPSYVTTLRALELPPAGGETWFCNTSAGYDALPEDRKRALADLQVVHDLSYSRSLVPNLPPLSAEERARVPAVVQPLVRTHSGTGRKVLYLGCHAREVVGMGLEDGRTLLQELEVWTTQPQFVYQHRWVPGDYVIWDNRGTMHKVSPYDASVYRRVMHRTEVSGDAVQLAA